MSSIHKSPNQAQNADLNECLDQALTIKRKNSDENIPDFIPKLPEHFIVPLFIYEILKNLFISCYLFFQFFFILIKKYINFLKIKVFF